MTILTENELCFLHHAAIYARKSFEWQSEWFLQWQLFTTENSQMPDDVTYKFLELGYLERSSTDSDYLRITDAGKAALTNQCTRIATPRSMATIRQSGRFLLSGAGNAAIA